jgi:hypothetical protein
MRLVHTRHLARILDPQIQVASLGVGKSNDRVKDIAIRQLASITLELNR